MSPDKPTKAEQIQSANHAATWLLDWLVQLRTIIPAGPKASNAVVAYLHQQQKSILCAVRDINIGVATCLLGNGTPLSRVPIVN